MEAPAQPLTKTGRWSGHARAESISAEFSWGISVVQQCYQPQSAYPLLPSPHSSPLKGLPSDQPLPTPTPPRPAPCVCGAGFGSGFTGGRYPGPPPARCHQGPQ